MIKDVIMQKDRIGRAGGYPQNLTKRLSCYRLRRISVYLGGPMPDDTTRWTVSVSKETDIAVRSFLAQRGMKKGDLSKFIEAVAETRQVVGPKAQ
jgi:hypothetical protein